MLNTVVKIDNSLSMQDFVNFYVSNKRLKHDFSKSIIKRFKGVKDVKSIYENYKSNKFNKSNKNNLNLKRKYLGFIFRAFRAACIQGDKKIIEKILKANLLKDIVVKKMVDATSGVKKEKRTRLEEVMVHVKGFNKKCDILKFIISCNFKHCHILQKD